MSTEVINLNNLGLWASAAQHCKANKDIFDLCLAVDIHMQLKETSFEFRGEKVDIVEPNIFIGGKLYDILTPYNESNDEALHELFDSLKGLSYEILFRDIMAQVQDSYSSDNRERFYRYGHNYGSVMNSFSERQYGFSVLFPHLENDNRTEIVYFDKDGEASKFNTSVEFARFVVENVVKDYYFGNSWLLLSILTPKSNHRFGFHDASTSGTIKTDAYNVEVGPLNIISTSDNVYNNDLIVTLNGRVVENGERILYGNSDNGILAEIVRDNYNDYLKYAYMDSVFKALGENVAELYKLEKVNEKIVLRRRIQGLLMPSNATIKHDRLDRREIMEVEAIAITDGLRNARKHIRDTSGKSKFDPKYTTKRITSTHTNRRGETIKRDLGEEIVRVEELADATNEKKIKVRKAIPVSANSTDDFEGEFF